MILTTYNIEREVGIECYLTNMRGIGGRIKTIPSDFVVEEIYNPENFSKIDKTSDYNVLDKTRKIYSIISVEKLDWDTHTLVREIARRLRISKKRIGFSGTKDKNALSTQIISIEGIAKDDIEMIKIKDVIINFIGYSNSPVKLGDHTENRFKITVRDISPSVDDAAKIITEINKEADDKGGLPNFFGMQRFGTIRPITHKVGEKILKKDFKGAVLTYLAYQSDYEPNNTKDARTYAEEEDFKNALRCFPSHLRYERALANHLVANPDDYIGALNDIQLGVRMMFIHAYQSYLFNKIVSARIKDGIFDKIIEGDYVYFKNGGIEKVDMKNVRLYESLIDKGRAYITAPLIGYDSVLNDFELELIEESEQMSGEDFIRSFKIKELPELSSRGTRRPISIKTNITSDAIDDALILSLMLDKGSYATSVLREIMKEDPLKANF